MKYSNPVLLVLPVLIALSACRKPEYEPVPVITLSLKGVLGNYSHYDGTEPVFFVNDAQGVVGYRNRLLFTEDGGAGWVNALPAGLPDYEVMSINKAGNTLVAFVDFEDTNSDSIYRSTSNGQYWQAFPASGKIRSGQAISPLEFYKAANSTSSIYSPLVLSHSTDAGSTWTPITLPANFELYKYYFSNSTTGIIISSENSPMYFTDDGGTTWQAVAAGITGFTHITTTDSRIYASYNLSDNAELIYSDDMGRTWNPAEFKSAPGINTGYLQDLAFSPDGSLGCAFSSGISMSEDNNGLSWKYYYDSDGSYDYGTYENPLNIAKVIVTPAKRALVITTRGGLYEIIR